MKSSILQLIFGALFLLLFGVNASAQVDVAMSRMISPESGQRVHLQFTYPFQFTILNFGNDPIPYSSLKFDILNDKQYWRTEVMPGTGSLNGGDSMEVILPGLSIASANPTIEICVVAKITGDIDATNDTLCVLLDFSLDNFIDFSPVLVRIIDPAITDSTIPAGTKLIEMEGYIKNVGNVTLPKDYTVLMRYSLYSNNRTFAGSTTSPLDPGGILTVTMKGGLPTVQNTPGPFNVCLNLLNGDDQNPNNNQYCQLFYSLDFTGIEELDTDLYQSFLYNDMLTIKKPLDSETIQIRIHNSLGQRVYLNSLANSSSSDDIINVGHLNPGLYIVDITDTDGRLLHNNKFTID